MPLPPLPKVELCQLEDLTPEQPPGFLRLRRHRFGITHPGDRESSDFVLDSVSRKSLDAVVIVAHYRDPEGQLWVYLRSALRPALCLRPMEARPFPEKETLGCLWEVPAGLVEADECNEAGLRRCAARELEEEVGFDLPAEQFSPLGPSTFPAVGLIGERHYYYHVPVEPEQRGMPTEDGSVLERDAVIVAVSLDEAMAAVRAGEIEDTKSELALRRLAERCDEV